MPLAALIAPAIAAVGGAAAAATLGAAAIGAGTAIYGASQAKKANEKATEAATAANDANIAANRENRDYIYNLNASTIAGGQGAFDLLLQEFGINPSTASTTAATSSAGGSTSAAPPPASTAARTGFDAQAYWNANPDLAADASLSGFNPGDLTGDGVVDNADRGAWHYQNYGQNEGRAAPQYAAPTTTAPTTTAPTTAPDLRTAPRPDPGPAPTYQRPPTATMPDVGPAPTRGAEIRMQDYGTAPTRRAEIAMQDYGRAPDAASYYANFAEDPGAAYRRSQALEGVNAYSAARGKLRSGDAAVALATRASDLGSQEYNNWFNRQSARLASDQGQFNANRAFAGNLYNSQNDRADSQYNADVGQFNNNRSYAGNLYESQNNRADSQYNANLNQYNTNRNDARNVFDNANARDDANFGNDRAYGTSMWDANRQRSDNNFNYDRNYQTGVADTRTDNLFRISNAGANAIGNVTSAGNNFTNNAMNSNDNAANIAGNSAVNRANANTGMVNTIGATAGNLFTSWGGGATAGRLTPNMLQQPYNPTFVNTPASINVTRPF
jgi:hypothetical protein